MQSGESQAAARIGASATIEVSMRAAALAARGVDVISLGTGEADFDTPAHVIDAAYAAMRQGRTRYTAVDGAPSLKEAIIAKLARENGLAYSSAEVLAGNGAKHVIALAMMATLDPGDEVIIPAPYWPSYPDIVRFCGGVVVPINCGANENYKLSPELLRRYLTQRTKWLIHGSPSNPSGAGYSKSEIRALAEVLEDFPQVLVLSDDIYEKIVFDGFEFVTFAEAAPQHRDRVLTVNGVSKSYAMTGWPLGYCAGPQWLVRTMAKIASQTSSNPCSISQAAAEAALNGPQDFLESWRGRFMRRTQRMANVLNGEHVRCRRPDGAYYVFPDVSGLIPALERHNYRTDDVGLTEYLLDHARIAVVPGEAFGAPGHIRLTCSGSDALLEDAAARFLEASSKLLRSS